MIAAKHYHFAFFERVL